MIIQLNDQPVALPMRCVLPDGASVLIRTAQPDDVARLERLFYRLSPQSIARYFFLPLPREPYWAMRLGELARTDGHDHQALVALVEDEIVGVARYDREVASEEAEFGLMIEDGWQQRGLGKRLLGRLVNEARRHGVSTFTAFIQGENRRALRLVAALFPTAQTRSYGPECLVQAPTALLRQVDCCSGEPMSSTEGR
jgi:GNAT superfamily N-acetyltransferase